MKGILWVVGMIAMVIGIAAGAMAVNAAPDGNAKTLNVGQTLTIKSNGCNLKVKSYAVNAMVVTCKASAKVPPGKFAPNGKVTLTAGQKQKVVSNQCNLKVLSKTMAMVKVTCVALPEKSATPTRTGMATNTPTQTQTPSKTLTPTATGTQPSGVTQRISADGNYGWEGESRGGVISPDGHYVALSSDADFLVGADNNGWDDVFVRDMETDDLKIASLDASGDPGSYWSYLPSISDDGRYVAFQSGSALTYQDWNPNDDIYVRDLQTNHLWIVTNGPEDTGGNHDSYAPSISGDGTSIAFYSLASNLVDDDTNHRNDVFVYSLDSGTITRVSVNSDGTEGDLASINPSVSKDGRYVVFRSWATNLVDDDTVKTCDTDLNGVFDDNCPDVFVHDMQTGETTLVSVASDGTHSNGGYQDYWTYGTAVISDDGRYVAFDSRASNLVAGDTNVCPKFGCQDVFVHDRQTGTTTRVSVSSDGTQANGDSTTGCISGDGRYVVFSSKATNLISGDANGASDVFLHDMQTGETSLISISTNGNHGNQDSSARGRCISADGTEVVFSSDSNNLVSSDLNLASDVFMRTR